MTVGTIVTLEVQSGETESPQRPRNTRKYDVAENIMWRYLECRDAVWLTKETEGDIGLLKYFGTHSGAYEILQTCDRMLMFFILL